MKINCFIIFLNNSLNRQRLIFIQMCLFLLQKQWNGLIEHQIAFHEFVTSVRLVIRPEMKLQIKLVTRTGRYGICTYQAALRFSFPVKVLVSVFTFESSSRSYPQHSHERSTLYPSKDIISCENLAGHICHL